MINSQALEVPHLAEGVWLDGADSILSQVPTGTLNRGLSVVIGTHTHTLPNGLF